MMATKTTIVMLGTGTAGPDPNRSGPATAIIANNTPYLIDFGPGVVRRAAAAFGQGVKAFGFGGIRIPNAFLTHLHADHTIGLPDLILTPWIIGRRQPLAIFGPAGFEAMCDHVLKAWKLDINNRINGAEKLCAAGCKVKVTEIKPGLIYQDMNVAVTAFPVRHGEMTDAFGFKFMTVDKSIVISGDTAPTEAIVEHSEGCDVLIHEAYSQHTYGKVSAKWKAYRRKYHTSSIELARIATRAKPKLLLLYHRASPGGTALPNPEHVLLDEIRRAYKGNVIVAHDLDVF